MDKDQFQQILEDTFDKVGFRCYRKTNFYYSTEELIIVINKQRGLYDDYYYINVGFMLKSIHEDEELKYPKVYRCDVRLRFRCTCQGAETPDMFAIEKLKETELRKCLEENIADFIVPVINEGIEKLFELYPRCMNCTTIALREYLESQRT